MSSFFRSANDITSSAEDETSDTISSDNGENTGQPEILGRITTISSDVEVGEIARSDENDQVVSPYQERAGWLPPGDAAGHQSFLLHALLEERCINQALEHLNRRSEAAIHYTRDDAEVQRQARQLYDDLCRHLVPKGLLPGGPEQERFRGHRQGYRQGLNLLSRGLSHEGRASALSRSNSTFALPAALQRVFEGSSPSGADSLSGAGLLQDRPPGLDQLSLQNLQLVPSPLDTIMSHQMLDMSRYGNEFAEMDRIGKGGYGEVFAVRHKISGVEYAVKKIPIGESRLRRIRERGQAELDALLNELRVLAKLDHPNIVRYYNGWLESTPGVAILGESQSSPSAQQLLLLDHEHDFEFSSPTSRELHLETRKGSIDIVFEHSETGVDPVIHEESRTDSDDVVVPPPRRRSETFSSTASRKSLATKASVEDEDDVIDVSRESMTMSNALSVDASSTGPLYSDLTGSAPSRTTSVLTLHLQMSLHPLTLADFISRSSSQDSSMALTKASKSSYSSLRHCFHTVISILIVLALLDGVEYLHGEGLVHRDLKPANIFLTPSVRPAYSSIEPCRHCQSSQPLHMNVRIGDFGLVTAMADPEHNLDGIARKAVGTQHYRPASDACYAHGDARLDMYALGVILFELLWPFQTRMERHDALDGLKNGALPADFASHVGQPGQAISECILDMVGTQRRMNCATVKQWLRNILGAITA